VGKCKLVWLGHVLRHESLLHDITEGRMKGKATRCRKRMHLLNDLVENKLHGSKMRSSRQSRLESWDIINLLITAED